MAWTQTDLDRIDAAIAGGTPKKVAFADGRSVEYHDLNQMIAARREIKAELTALESQTRPFVRATRARLRRR